MTKSEILDYLKTNMDERGVAHWEKHADKSGGLKSYGIGLTRLRKFSKTVGKNPDLARELWESDVYDLKIISLLIDDPKTMTMDQAENQVSQLQGGYLAHVFSSCGAPLAKTSFVVELADRWVNSDSDARMRCGYGLLYEISKSKKKSAPGDDYFLAHIAGIEASYSGQSIPVLMAMAAALMGIGMRNRTLNGAALEVANMIGPIDFDPDGQCDPMDVSKRLTGDYVKAKLGL